MILKRIGRLVAVFAIALSLLLGTAAPPVMALPIDPNICPADANPSLLEQQLRQELGDKQYEATFLTYEGCPEEMGAWYMLPMPENEADRMQAVHAVLLPSNKVLIVNGSSNRNTLTANGTFIDGVNNLDYDVVNNTSIFNPALSDPFYLDSTTEPDFTGVPFTRIASPITPVPDPTTGNSEPNDPFCSGHLQLPDGDVLFAGGTRRYYPGDQFQGAKTANFFDWKTESWGLPHLLEDGHWYPTLVPLHNGAIAIFSGIKALSQTDISPIVEIYDPNQIGTANEWQAIDISQLPNSPFNTRMNDKTYAPDYLDLYPRIFPIKTSKKDKFLITGDGGGKVPLPVHTSFNSYFVTFDRDTTGKYSISFEEGPKREATSKVYGTAAIDPSSPNGDVLLYGGIIGTTDISFGPGKYAISGASVPASVERWVAPDDADCTATNADTCKGYWEIYDQFLAHIDEDIVQTTELGSYPPKYAYYKTSADLGSQGNRAMQLVVTLPTKQVLMVNGGVYAERRPVFNPTLLTPDASKTGGFSTKRMNPDIEARLYHNTALLLPDGRVLVMGGNPSRAARLADGTVRTDTVNDFSLASPGSYYIAGEIYRQAIYYPPYLFTNNSRPEIAAMEVSGAATTDLHFGDQLSVTINDVPDSTPGDNGSFVLIKLGSVTHSLDRGQELIDVAIENVQAGATPTFNLRVPDNSVFVPPAYYMLFYVSSEGVPSHAKIVHLS